MLRDVSDSDCHASEFKETRNYLPKCVITFTHPKSLVEWGEKADASNSERGLLSLPVELTTEILDYFPTIGPYTASCSYNASTVLLAIFLVRIRILRALSQVCIDYRRGFLPLVWDSLDLSFKMRQVNLWECRDEMSSDVF